MVLVQLVMIGSVGWLLTATVASLGGKEMTSMIKAATLFACLALGTEWLFGICAGMAAAAEAKLSLLEAILNFLN